MQLDGEEIDFEQSDDGLVMQTGALAADSQHTAGDRVCRRARADAGAEHAHRHG